VQTDKRQKTLLVLAIVVIGLFLGDKVILTPLVKSWKSRAARIQEMRKRLTEDKALLQREQSIRRRWEEMRQNTLTNNPSAAEQQFYRALVGWAQDSRVTINSSTPQWKKDEEDYVTYQCRLDVSGNLAGLSKFLYNVEKDPMALKVESLELGARDKQGQQLTLAMQVSGLILNPKGK
jgi:Tfp pilus assembly protein PilO